MTEYGLIHVYGVTPGVILYFRQITAKNAKSRQKVNLAKKTSHESS